MRKTILNDSAEIIENQTVATKATSVAEELTELMKEMKNTWQEASGDLMQPRTEVLNQLLKKVLH